MKGPRHVGNFRVFGDRVTKYYVDVEAADPVEAYEAAEGKALNEWTELETDETVQSYDYEELVITDTMHEYRGHIIKL
jgi:hypothetical protein